MYTIIWIGFIWIFFLGNEFNMNLIGLNQRNHIRVFANGATTFNCTLQSVAPSVLPYHINNESINITVIFTAG